MPVRPRADIRKPHPAKFSEGILLELGRLLDKYEVEGLVLDPFAGVGRVHELRDEDGRIQTTGVEIEPEWARWHPDTICDDARNVPKLFQPGEVKAIVTSPTYGNRMADHHEAMDGSKRHTYKEYLGRDTSVLSTSSLQWGSEYRDAHYGLWSACLSVLDAGGYLFLNGSNHIRNWIEQPVVEAHVQMLLSLGMFLREVVQVDTKRQRHGANREARTPYELIVVLQKRAGDV
jgi:DNA modification methylase